jgi:hypothetical protein
VKFLAELRKFAIKGLLQGSGFAGATNLPGRIGDGEAPGNYDCVRLK